MSDHFPDGLNALFEEYKTRRPFLDRVKLWLRTPLLWASTKWEYPSLFGVSKQRFPKWDP